MTREARLEQILNEVKDGLVVCSLGVMSRELYELREKRKEEQKDFYMMGSMGCAIGFGLGIALNTDKQVYVLTGDGALLMKLGSLTTVFKNAPSNLHIILINNSVHESTGYQNTAIDTIVDELETWIQVYKVDAGHRLNLKRIDKSPEQITKDFHEKVSSNI